uniref:Ovule protein n=1 Tax=Strongyloides stercoralis TaxID=6248 RepID=A0A0K0EQS2_STRER
MLTHLSIGRRLLNPSNTTLWKRKIHKGPCSTPPMRFIPIKQKIALFVFVVATFISYPSYVISNLNSIRSPTNNSLSPEVVEELEKRKVGRNKS